MPEYPADLVTQPAAEAAAFVCLAILEAAHVAGQRLTDRTDSEALHDFRVAIRRLRSTLRSFRSELDDAVPKKLRNRLRDLTQSTARGRDAEVMIALVKTLETKVARGQRAGLPWLLARFADRRDRAYEDLRRDLAPEFQRLERRLRKALWVAGRTPGGTAETAPFGAVAAVLLVDHAALLEQELATLQSPDDESTAHAIRITAKHLRYLLELLVGSEPRAAPILTQVKEIQTVLGDLHDLQVLAAQIADGVGDAAAERARRQHELTLAKTPQTTPATRGRPRAATTGMLALARVVHQGQDETYRRFAADWQSESRAGLWNEVAIVAAALASPPSPPPERRHATHPLRRATRRAVT